MPISDEIIELEPVKKSKGKLIALIAVAAAMFALAVTFLVLFLVKPGGGGGNVGKVHDINVNQSSFFASASDGDGKDVKLYASVGHEYIVRASVSADDGVSKDVTWECSPTGAIIVDDRGSDEDGSYIRFMPNASYADGTLITLTAKSADADVTQTVKFYIVAQDTKYIEFIKYVRNNEESSSQAIENNTIQVPFYSTSSNNKSYRMVINQLGAYDESTDNYAPLTLANGINDITVTSSDPDIISIDRVEQIDDLENPAWFEFKVKKISDKGKPVTITVSTPNGTTERLTVNAMTPFELGLIEKIYIADQPIFENSEIYKKLVSVGESNWLREAKNIGVNWLSAPNTASALTLPYGAQYSDILSHVVLFPIGLQYDSESNEFNKDWRDKISVVSSNKDVLDIQSNSTQISCSKALSGAREDLKLTFSDNTRTGIATATAKLNIVAQNFDHGMTVSSGSNNYDENEVRTATSSGKGIPVSTGIEATIDLTYKFIAPQATDPATMLSRGQFSTGFMISVERYDDGGSTVRAAADPKLRVYVGETEIKDPNEVYDYVKSFEVTHGAATAFTGTASVRISVEDGTPSGKYLVTYTKVGTQIGEQNKYTFNNHNPSWSYEILFNVTSVASSAAFVSSETGTKMVQYSNVGKFVAGEVKQDNGIYKGKSQLYVQNRSEGAADFKMTDLVVPNGNAVVTASASNVSNGGYLSSRLSDYKLSFTGSRKTANFDTRDLLVTVTVKAGEKTIAELTIDVFVVDAIVSIDCGSTEPATVMYGGKEGDFGHFAKDSVYATYKYAGRSVTTYTTNNFELGYDVGNGEFVPFNENGSAATAIGYSWDGDADGKTLFEYSGGRFLQKFGLIEYSKTHNTNLTHIVVRYYLNDADEDGFKELSGVDYAQRDYIFVRKADDVGVYSDEGCTKLLGTLPTDGNVFVYYAPLNDFSRLWVAPIIKYSDGHTTVALSKEYDEYAHEAAYITVHSAFTEVGGSQNPSNASQYSAISFKVPTPEISKSVTYSLSITVGGRTQSKSLQVVARNLAQPITSLDFYALDDSGNITGTKLSALEFANYNNTTGTKWYSKDFAVVATYAENKTAVFETYESFAFTVPSDWSLYSLGGTDNALTSFTFVPSDTPDANGNAYTYELKLTLRLNDDAKAHRTDNTALTVSSLNAKSSVSLTADTGIADIKFDIGNGNYISANNQTAAPISVTLADNKSTTSETFEIPLEYITLGGISFPNLDYNFGNIGASATTTVGGVIYHLATNDDGERVLQIIVNGTTVNGTHNYTVTITDRAGYDQDNKAFALKFALTVAHDIYNISQPASYTVTTDGTSGSMTTPQDVSITYNDSNYAPTDTSEVKVGFVLRSGAANAYTYEAYNDTHIAKIIGDAKSGYTFSISNALTSGKIDEKDLCICVSDGTHTSYAPINVTTTATGLRYSNISNVPVTSGAENTAAISIATRNDTFKLCAEVYNISSGDADTTKTVTYKLYSKAGRTEELDWATIDENGVISLVGGKNPPAYGGTIYYRASADGHSYDVAISYTVNISGVSLVDIDGNVLSNDTLTLYYLNSSAYTTLSLNGKIKVSSAFDIDGQPSGVTYSLTSNGTTVLTAGEDLVLTPKQAGQTTLKITATCNGKTVEKTYNVNIVMPAFSLGATSGSIDITDDNGNVVITPSIDSKYSTVFDLTFSVSNPKDGKLNISGTGNDKTVTLKRDGWTNADYTTYTLTASYTFAAKASSDLIIKGDFTAYQNYTLTVTNGYDGKFTAYDLKVNGNTIAIDETTKIGTVTVANNDTTKYTIEFGAPYNANYGYSATVNNNNVVSVSNFVASDNKTVATVTPTKTAFGTVEIAITVTVYGKTYTVRQSYNFVSDITVTSSMTDGASAVVANKSSHAIDFAAATEQKKFRYTLSSSQVTFSDENTHFTFIGDATNTINYGAGYIEFTATKPTKLTVIGYVEVNGRRYYGEEYEITLIATEPNFALNVADELSSVGDVSLGVTKADDFKGTYTDTYAFVGTVDSDIATISGSTLKLGVNRTQDTVVTIRATVTVDSGAFSGTTYTCDKIVTIKGAALPVWTVNSQDVHINIGDTITLSEHFALTKTDGVTVGNIEYELPDDINYSTPESVDGSYIVQILDGDGSRPRDLTAGTVFEITAKAKVTSAINEDAVVTAKLTVYVDPTVNKVSTEFEGRKGAYDIKNAVSIVTGTATGAFTANDTYSVVYSSTSLPSGITLDGSTVTLDNNITGSDITLTLTATVTITSDTHKGTTLTVRDVPVKVKAVPQYTVTFEANGGSTVASQTVLDGGKVNCPVNPTREGYTFAGWKNGDDVYDFETPVRADITLTADWTINRYTVTFDTNGGSSVANQTVNHGAAVSTPTETPAKDGYTFGGWYLNGSAYDFATLVTGDITLVAQWNIVNYTVTFKDGNSTVYTQTVAHGYTATAPIEPTKTGYDFVEWQLTGSAYDFTETVTGDITLTAKWSKKQYTVTFDANGGSTVANQTVEYNGNATAPSNPEKTGYTFGGWYSNGSEYDFDEKVTGDITLVAHWNAITYTVTFVYGNGSGNTHQTVAFGGKAVEPKDPTREGYTFAGWKNGETVYNFNETVTEDISLTAKWNAITYTVTFVYDNGSGNTSETVAYNGKATEPTNPTKEGYVFDGWYLNGSEYDFTKTVTGNITLVARWSTAVYVVTFNADNGSENVTINVSYNNTVARPQDPTKTGHTFVGWFVDVEGVPTAYDFAKLVTGNITLTAQWNAITYTVTFDANGGTLNGDATATATVNYGCNVTAPSEPMKDGHTFGGWYKDAECTEINKFDFESETVTGDITLYAKWTENTEPGGGETTESTDENN